MLVPTRELAMQVAEALHKYAKGSQLNVVPVYGGAPMDHQIRALRRGAEVVVGTPGRVLDHLRRRTLELSAVQVLVLDEADEMLDMGFRKTSTRSSRRHQRPGRRRCSRRRLRRASCRSPDAT